MPASFRSAIRSAGSSADLLAVELMGDPAIGRAVGGFLESLGLISAEAVQGAGSWRLLFMVAFLVIPIAVVLYWCIPESRRFLAEKEAQEASSRMPA